MQTSLVLIFALAFLLGIFGAIGLSRMVLKPLKRLTLATREVAAGNLDISVPVDTNDEIGELTATFNSMVVATRENRDKLIERANTDSLTGLYNHRYFQERLRSELKRAERYGRPLSVIIADLDHFKTLNDTHGHPVGDMVLCALAEVMQAERSTSSPATAVKSSR